MARTLETAGIVFMFAPLMHPALRHVGPIRRELGVPTVMNIVGPLANPARAGRQVVGVAEPARLTLLAEALATLGSRRALVVHGTDGMDEITRKPGIRNAALLLGAMADHGVELITRRSLELYLGCLARDETDEANLEHALPTLERAANRPDGVIDEAVRREFARTALHLCKEEAA